MTARNLDIFVVTQSHVETLKRDLESFLGLQAQPVNDNEYILYRFVGKSHEYTEISTHIFFNDEELNFEDYQYRIAVRILRASSLEDRNQKQDAIAKSIFEHLKETGKYGLMMVDDLGELIDRFNPEGTE